MNLDIINLILEIVQLAALSGTLYFAVDSWRMAREARRKLDELQKMLAHGIGVVVEHSATGEFPSQQRTRH